MLYSYHSILKATLPKTNNDCWRKYKKKGSKQLGKLAGASEAYVRVYESGRRNPKSKFLDTIAKALAVKVEVLTNSDLMLLKPCTGFSTYSDNLIDICLSVKIKTVMM